MTFEEQVKDYIDKNFSLSKGCKNWWIYETMKNRITGILNPSPRQYDMMVRIITDWLDL